MIKLKKLKPFANIYKDLLKISFLNLNKQFINFYFQTYHEKDDYEFNLIELCILNFDGIANFGNLNYLRDYNRKKEPSILKLSQSQKNYSTNYVVYIQDPK